MQYAQAGGACGIAAEASAAERGAFIVRTYAHLAGAMVAFVVLEAILLNIPAVAITLTEFALGGRLGWVVFLGAFIGVSWVAERWARTDVSPAMQYAGLALYVVAEAVLFVPLLAMVVYMMEAPEILPQAAVITLTLFGGLTGVVFLTRKDFSFLKGILGMCAVGAFGIIVASLLFGFTLGLVFSGAMVMLAGGYILYYTSNVLHHYRTDQHVAAALTLFSAVALLLWYVVRILASRR